MADNPYDQFVNPYDQFTAEAPVVAPTQQGQNLGALGAFSGGVNSGLAKMGDAVLNTPQNIVDLLKAGAGTAYHATSGNPIPSWLQVPENSQPNFIQSALQGSGADKYVTSAPNPADPTQAAAHNIGELAAPGVLTPGTGLGSLAASAAISTGIGGLMQYGAQLAPEHPVLGTALQIATMAVPAGSAAAKESLAAAAARTEARAVNDGLATLPAAPLTQPNFAQSSGSPAIRTFAAGSAGRLSQIDLKNQAVSLANDAKALANRIAPIPLTAPALAEKVQGAIKAKDTALFKQGQAVYETGRTDLAALTKTDKTWTQFPNVKAAADDLKAQYGNLTNLFPTTLTPRTKQLLNFMFGDAGPVNVKVNALGALDVGKALNELREPRTTLLSVPGSKTAYNALKNAFNADVAEASSTSPAFQKIGDINSAYAPVAKARTVLRNSSVNKVIGADVLADPDGALAKIVSMGGTKQAYARQMLEKFDPDALNQLQSLAVKKWAERAQVTGGAQQDPSYNLSKLDASQLTGTGLFTPEQIGQLHAISSAARTFENWFPKVALSKTTPSVEQAGRLSGGLLGNVGGAAVFWSGFAANLLSSGKLQTYLTTRAGRDLLLHPQTQEAIQRALLRRAGLLSGQESTTQTPANQDEAGAAQ